MMVFGKTKKLKGVSYRFVNFKCDRFWLLQGAKLSYFSNTNAALNFLKYT